MITVKTPRGTIYIQEIFTSDQEANSHGYGYWFTHRDTNDRRMGIYSKSLDDSGHRNKFAIVMFNVLDIANTLLDKIRADETQEEGTHDTPGKVARLYSNIVMVDIMSSIDVGDCGWIIPVKQDSNVDRKSVV